MKSAYPKLLTLCITTVVVSAGAAWAGDSPQVKSAVKTLRAVSAIEMPATAAKLVAQAQADQREAVAGSVTTAALQVRPTSALAVVGAIARLAPEAAAPTVVKAATLQPKNLSDIVSAAASAAPGQVAKIVEALCKVMPTKYALIATAAAKAVPTAAKEIVAAVTAAVPNLRPFVNRATSDFGGQDAGVALLMSRTEALVDATAKAGHTTPEQLLAGGNPPPVVAALGPPVVQPPFTPLPPGEIPGETTRNKTRVVPPGGGRDYSRP
jgi:hypothetical protein